MPHPLQDLVLQKGRRSARRPRTTQWGEYVLRDQQPPSLQDELDALEALCFLSAGQVPDLGAQQETHPSKATSSKRLQHHGRQPKQSQQGRQHKRQQPAKKQHSRQSLGSETSSGATQCGLAPAQASVLQADLTMAVEDVHPAAIAGPEIMQQLLQISTHKSRQVEKQQHGAGESSDTRLAVSALTPMASDEHAAQSRQCAPGSQVVPASPTPLQQELAAGNAVAAAPAAEPAAAAAAAAQPAVLQHQEQPMPVIFKPPVKGCLWHVYIAKLIHADQQRKEQQQQNKVSKQQPSTSKRPQQQQAEAAVGGSLSKKRRTEPKQQQQRTTPQQQNGSASPTNVAGVPAGQQQAAAVQHVLVQTILQQQHQGLAAPGLSALLGQQMPPALQLLQQAMSAASTRAAPQLPAAVPTSPLDLLSGLPPAIQAAAAGCPQLLQALGAATAPHANLPGLGFSAGLPGAGAAGRFGAGGLPGGLQAAAFMGAMPAAPPPAAAQLQCLFGHGAPAAAVGAPPSWSGLGHLGALLGAGSMPQLAAQAGRVAV